MLKISPFHSLVSMLISLFPLSPLLTLLTLIFGTSLGYHPEAHSSSLFQKEKLQEMLEGGLLYLQESQKKETKGEEYFKGEWDSYMTVDVTAPMLGQRGKKYYDSNNFASSHVHNILSEIYLNHPHYEFLLPMLEMSYFNLMSYENNGRFNFWHLLPRYPGSPIMQRRPNNFPFPRRTTLIACHINEDSDDTSANYMAIKYHDEIAKRAGRERPKWVPSNISSVFDEFRDFERPVWSVWNFMTGRRHPTGAYLTWFTKEEPNPRTILPQGGKTFLPFGTNDIDCVVNANILSTLSFYGELDQAKGARHACTYIKNSIRTNKHKLCGMYYPNWYTLYYTVARAHSAYGVQCFEQELPRIVRYLKNNQQQDGRFLSYKNWLGRDSVHSTALALATLVHIGNFDHYGTWETINRAISYLDRMSQKNGQQISWEGGTHFTGGTLVRMVMAWRSSAYTTAIVLEALAKLLPQLPSQLHFLPHNLRPVSQ